MTNTLPQNYLLSTSQYAYDSNAIDFLCPSNSYMSDIEIYSISGPNFAWEYSNSQWRKAYYVYKMRIVCKYMNGDMVPYIDPVTFAGSTKLSSSNIRYTILSTAPKKPWTSIKLGGSSGITLSGSNTGEDIFGDGGTYLSSSCPSGYVIVGFKAQPTLDNWLYNGPDCNPLLDPIDKGKTLAHGAPYCNKLCEACPINSICNLGESNPLNCPPGSYGPINGQSPCSLCPVGFFTDSSGSSNCLSCFYGKYSSVEGSSTCTDCSSGKTSFFDFSIGSKQCNPCAAGYYAPISGSGNCLPCLCGTFSNSGSTGCGLCPINTYARNYGSSTCLQCSKGTYTSTEGNQVCDTCASIPLTATFTSLCQWKCNAGYYKNTASSCTTCSESTNCPVGKFNPPCTDGINDEATCRGTCTNKPNQNESIYTGPSIDHTESKCPWGCQKYSFLDPVQLKCLPCQKTCNTSQYPYSMCYIQVTNSSDTKPQCLDCKNQLNNSYFSGQGTANDPMSCLTTCNDGYYATFTLSVKSCSKWTERRCDQGQVLIYGNATTDTSCINCMNKKNLPEYVYDLNKCSYGCGGGYEININSGDCVQCVAGKYKSALQSTLSSCMPCPESTYQESAAGSECKTVPLNGYSNNLKTDFSCNSGYFRINGDLVNPDPSCLICTNNNNIALSQAKNIIWNTSAKCVIASFSCNLGYYRNWTYQGCKECPASVPSNSTSTVGLTCALCSNTTAESDRNSFCPFQCNNGYYASPNLNYSCIRCASRICSVGLFLQPCSNGGTTDLCLNCSYQLKPFQDWTYTTPCQWQCAKEGYFLSNVALTCQLCTAGKYKTNIGNQSCLECPMGSYSASPLSCQFCDRGTYSNLSLSTSCLLCERGTYASSSNTTSCKKCLNLNTYPSSISFTTGVADCVLCPDLTPYSANGITCSLPFPPCPQGFYISPLSPKNVSCELCPIGTYCNISGSANPFICPFSTPFSNQPAISIENCSLESFLRIDNWRAPCINT